MLNEPFRILDNIPLIWCFASFETYQSRLLEIVTQTQGLADAPQPTQQVFSVLSAFTGPRYACLVIHFHTNFTPPVNLSICIPTWTSDPGIKLCWCLQGREEEMRDEKWGGCTSNCLLSRHVEPVWRRDTRGGGGGGAGRGMSSISAWPSK